MLGKFSQKAWLAAEKQDISDAAVSDLALASAKLFNSTNATAGEILLMTGKCEVMSHAGARQFLHCLDVYSSSTDPLDRAAARSGMTKARALEAAFDNLAAKLSARLP